MNMDVSFVRESEVTAVGANRFRYNIRSGGAGGGANAAESLDPNNVTIATQVMPEAGDGWGVGEGANTSWSAGDTVILTLARNAASPDDPNAAQCGVFGITFDYEADQ